MSIVSASSLSSTEMLLLGNNILPRVKRERVAAMSGSVTLHREQVERLGGISATDRRHASTPRNGPK